MDILEQIQNNLNKQKSRRINRTFYIKEEIFEKIKQLAEYHNVSPNKIIEAAFNTPESKLNEQ